MATPQQIGLMKKYFKRFIKEAASQSEINSLIDALPTGVSNALFSAMKAAYLAQKQAELVNLQSLDTALDTQLADVQSDLSVLDS